MVLPKLPNEIIMTIIKQADGGLTAHKKKMSETLKNISLGHKCMVRFHHNEYGDSMMGLSTEDWGFVTRGELYGCELCEFGQENCDGIYNKFEPGCDGWEEENEKRIAEVWGMELKVVGKNKYHDIFEYVKIPTEVEKPNPTEVEKPFDIWSCGC